MKHIKGLDKLKNLVNKLEVRNSTVQAMDGEVVDQNKSFVPGPYLHQNVVDDNGKIILTEEESAKLERDNPELFNAIRNLKVRIDRTMLDA